MTKSGGRTEGAGMEQGSREGAVGVGKRRRGQGSLIFYLAAEVISFIYHIA